MNSLGVWQEWSLKLVVRQSRFQKEIMWALSWLVAFALLQHISVEGSFWFREVDAYHREAYAEFFSELAFIAIGVNAVVFFQEIHHTIYMSAL